MPTVAITRRAWLGRSILGLTVLGVGSAVSACGGEEAPALDCTHPAGLTEAQTTQRAALAYKDHSPDPFKTCLKCNFFTAAQPDQCGNCTLNLGNVNPAGTCNSFTLKT
jgi:hypothetical protein